MDRRDTFTFRLDTSVPNNLFVSKLVSCKISDILLSHEVMAYIKKFYDNMVLFNKGVTDIMMKRYKRRNENGKIEYGIDLVFTFAQLENEEKIIDINDVTAAINTVKI